LAKTLHESTGWAENTVRTMLTRLVEKGARAIADPEVQPKKYVPAVERYLCVKAESASFLDRIFQGAAKPLLVHFAQNANLTAEEARELKKFLDRSIQENSTRKPNHPKPENSPMTRFLPSGSDTPKRASVLRKHGRHGVRSSIAPGLAPRLFTNNPISFFTLLVVAATLAVASPLRAQDMDHPPEDFASLFEGALVDRHGNPVDVSTLEGKFVGVFFSAGWCAPCRKLTPALLEFRKLHADTFEVVFVSGDRSAEAQAKYMENYQMESPTLPFGSPVVQKLHDKFPGKGWPRLFFLDPDGRVVILENQMELPTLPVDSPDVQRVMERYPDRGIPRMFVSDSNHRLVPEEMFDGAPTANWGRRGLEMFADGMRELRALAGKANGEGAAAIPAEASSRGRENFTSLFEGALVDRHGSPVDTSVLDGRLVCIYFASSVESRANNFTSTLAVFRNLYSDDFFEVVFVNVDDSAEAQTQSPGDQSMEWPTLPFGSPVARKLEARFFPNPDNDGNPKLVFLAPDGTMIKDENLETKVQQVTFVHRTLQQWRERAGKTGSR
jgi:BlaI family penicillinase repressor